MADSTDMSGHDSADPPILMPSTESATTAAPTISPTPTSTGVMVTPGTLLVLVNLTIAGTSQEQTQAADIVSRHLVEHAGVNGTAAVLVSVFMHSQGGDLRDDHRALNVILPNITNARCALAADEHTEAWVSLTLVNTDPTLVDQVLEQILTGDAGLRTTEGVPLEGLICRASTTMALAPYDYAAIPPETGKREKKRSLSSSTTTAIVVGVLMSLLLLMVCVIYFHRHNTRQRGRLSAVVALSPPNPTGKVIAVGNPGEGGGS